MCSIVATAHERPYDATIARPLRQIPLDQVSEEIVSHGRLASSEAPLAIVARGDVTHVGKSISLNLHELEVQQAAADARAKAIEAEEQRRADQQAALDNARASARYSQEQRRIDDQAALADRRRRQSSVYSVYSVEDLGFASELGFPTAGTDETRPSLLWDLKRLYYGSAGIVRVSE